MSTNADLVIAMLAFHREGRTGVATIRSEGQTTFVYFRGGVVVFAEEGTSGETLGRLLVRQHVLSQERYVEIISKMTDAFVLNEQLRFGEVGIELGYLSEEQVTRALGDQIRWKIVRAFQWRQSSFTFEHSRSRVDDAGNFPMPIESLVLEAMRWIDDDQKMVLGLAAMLDVVLCIGPEDVPSLAERFGLTEAEHNVALRLNGTRTVRELLTAENEESVDNHALVTALILAGVAVPAEAPAAPARAAAPAPAAPARAVAPAPAAPVRAAAPAPAAPVAAAAVVAPPPPKRRPRMPGSRTSQILKALGAQRVKVDPERDPESLHEAKLLAERAFQNALEHMKSGRYQHASSELERAVRLLPSSAEYRLYEKWCALRGRGEPPHALDLAELRRLATAALASDPNLAFGYCVTGDLALGEGNYKLALSMLKRAEKLDPNLLEVKRLLRLVERRQAGKD